MSLWEYMKIWKVGFTDFSLKKVKLLLPLLKGAVFKQVLLSFSHVANELPTNKIAFNDSLACRSFTMKL